MTRKNNTHNWGGGYNYTSLLIKNFPFFSLFLIVLLALSLVFTACKEPDNNNNGIPDSDTTDTTDTNDTGLDPSVPLIANNAEELLVGLAKYKYNTADDPIQVTLNVSDLRGDYKTPGSIGSIIYLYGLVSNRSKYISLDMSGSTFTGIGDSAFYDCNCLTSVTIPDSVTSIGDAAFYLCARLTSVTIGNSVKSIGNGAFSRCTSLTSATIGNSVESIGDYAFSDCTSLEGVTIPDSVTSIGNEAFYGCNSLASVTIGNSVTSIGWYTFYDCTSLTSVTIGNSVKSIGYGAFYGCTSLASVTIPDSVESIRDYAFSDCTSLVSVTFQVTGILFIRSPSTYYEPFPGDLRDKYLDTANGGIGTYTREPGGTVWTKQ